MGCAGVGRKPTESPIEFEATPTSIDGYLTHLSYDENTGFEKNQELYVVDIVEGPAEITFSLEIGDPELASLIEIDPQTGVITAVDDFSPDHEDGDEEFEVTVVASTQRQQVRQTIKVTINDINDEAPTFSARPADSRLSVNENSQFSTQVRALPDAELDGVTIRYSLSGDDAHLFDIDVQTGQLTAKSDTVFDHESGKTEYELTILATTYHIVDGLAQPASYDGKELVTELEISISVTDIDEVAPFITSSAGGNDLVDKTEVGTSTAIYTATGIYDATPIVWSLKEGNSDDAGLFDINSSSGVVTFKQATTPDHGSGKTSYNFTVVATAGDFITEKAITVSIVDVNDEAPEITSDTSLAIADNTPFTTARVIYAAQATPDVVGDLVSWSLKSDNNDDAGLFDINALTGAVTFKQATTPDHESGKTRYAFTVVATTGNLSSEQDVVITITDVNDVAPTITSSDSGTALVENTEVATTTTIYRATATPDIAGDSIAWTLKDNNGDDAGLFDIDRTSGVVTFKSATTPDHESGKTSYAFTIVATTGNLSSEQDVTIAVTEVNEAPVISSSDSAAALTENQTVPVTQTLYTAQGTYDLTPIVWSIDRSKQDDGGLFTIDSGTGEVRFANATQPNYEAKDSYSFTIVATSGSLSSDKVVTIAVADANDIAPVITSSDSGTALAENIEVATTTAVYNATATPDIAGDAVAWSFKTTDANGDSLEDDAGLFDINASTGVVTFKASTTPNYEAKDSYRFTIVATTGGPSSEKMVTISVTDVASPRFVSGAVSTITLEDSVTTFDAVTFAATSTVASASVTYSLVAAIGASDDVNAFQIDATTGVLTAASNAEFVHETKSSYEFYVVATAAGETASHKVTVTVNAPEESTFITKATTHKGDIAYGASGTDVIDGTEVHDFINAGSGDDTITTNNGANGGDIIKGGEGRDTIDGGEGQDTAIYSSSNAGVFVDLSGRQDADGYFIARDGHAEGDRLKGVENLAGSNYADDLTGDSNENVLKGGDGNDYIRGGAGDDSLYSGRGDDTLIGGKGDDKIILDSGKDIVVVTFNSNSTASGQWALTSGQDVIDNFHRGQDKIIFVDENDTDQPILTLNDFLYDDNSPLIRGIYPTGSTFPTLNTVVIEFQGNSQKLTINLSTENRYALPRYDEEQPTDANNGFLLKSYASFAPFMGGTDAIEFYEIDNLPANVDLI